MPQPKFNILIVDDNPSDRLIVRSMLNALGIKDIQEAEGGAIAEGKAWTASQIGEPFDLIILDWNMPRGNGQKLLQTLKREHASKVPKLIVMTATAEREIVESAIAAGADDFIVKPIDREILKAKLVKLQLRPS